MKKVLIVDDEKSFLLSLEAGLRQYAQSFAIVTASNGKDAVEVLKGARIDLVVTDLHMPEMDGFELLAVMAKNHPDVPVMIMTAYSTPALRRQIEALGSLRVHEKPIDVKRLAESILGSLSSTDRSYLRGITLPAFLQLVELERKTCTLKISSKGLAGFLCFRDGQLLEATAGSERGERAAYSILSWDDVAIEVIGICKVTTNNIGKSLNHVIMEAFRLKDEQKAKAPAAVDAPSGAAPSKAAANVAPVAVAAMAPAPAKGATAQATSPAGPVPAPAANVHESKQTEGEMGSIRTILSEFTKLQGVSAVCLVGRDGFLLDSIANRGIDTEMIGAIASNGYGASESMGKQLGKGSMSMTMAEFERGPVMYSPVGEDSLIVIIAEKDANLGMIRMKLKKEVQALATATST